MLVFGLGRGGRVFVWVILVWDLVLSNPTVSGAPYVRALDVESSRRTWLLASVGWNHTPLLVRGDLDRQTQVSYHECHAKPRNCKKITLAQPEDPPRSWNTYKPMLALQNWGSYFRALYRSQGPILGAHRKSLGLLLVDTRLES